MFKREWMLYPCIVSFCIVLIVDRIDARNIVLNQPITGNLDNLSYLNDGDTLSNYSSFKKTSDTTAMLFISLEKKRNLSSINFYTEENLKVENFSLFVSDDIVNWKKIEDGMKVREGKINETIKILTIEFSKAGGQYVKALLTPGNPETLKIYEMEVISLAGPDTISGIEIRDITENSAVVSFRTSNPSYAKVNYGERIGEFKVSSINLQASDEFNINLKGLKKGTMYYYQIQVQGADKDMIVTIPDTFVTKGIPEPKVTGISYPKTDKNSVEIQISTNIPTRCDISFGKESDKLGSTLKSENLNTTHKFIIDGLKPQTEYFYKIFYDDGSKIVTYELMGIQKFTTGENNIALNKSVTGTFLYDEYGNLRDDSGQYLARVNDGRNGFDNGMVSSGDVSETDQFVVIDLDETQKLEKVVVEWRKLAYPRNYSVSVSKDGNGWQTIDSGIDATLRGKSMASQKGDPMLVVSSDCKGAEARYVKVFLAKGSKIFVKENHPDWRFVQMMETKVYKVEEQ